MTGLLRLALLICALAPIAMGSVEPALAAAGGKAFSCDPVPDPVIALSYGSRYTQGDDTHSEIDVESDANVNAALKPVDSFVGYLSRTANSALLSDKDRQARIDCVANSLAAWAKAGALTKLDSLDANLSVGARFAGIAIALQQVEKAGKVDPATRATVVGWLTERATALAKFFDDNSKMNASRNNLRAWTGLGVGVIGNLANNPQLADWGRESFKLVACAAGPDGSLPLEMGRASRALSYQLHAIAPLVLSAALLGTPDFDGFSACDGVLKRIAGFTFAAVKDPSIVEKITGQPQSFKAGDEKSDSFVMAWAEPYLAHVDDPQLEAFVAPLRPLGNSKLGGNLTALYSKTD